MMRARHFHAMVLVAGMWVATCEAALHLMFPYDYLSMPHDERRLYVLAVVDTRLAPLGSSDRLEWLTRCLVEQGVTRVQHVVENEVIPSPESAVIPMPYVVERALQIVCKDYARAPQ